MAFTEIVTADNSPVIGETVDGVQTIQSDGVASDTTLVAGGTQYVREGGLTDGVTMAAGSVLSAMGAGATLLNITINGQGSTMQISGAGTTAESLTITGADFAKAEIWNGATATDVVVDAGEAIEMGAGKAGAYLIVTGEDASAENVVITNYGSASVYNGAYIGNVEVSSGGVLAMSYRKLTDGSTAGVANNVDVLDGGVFWVGTLGAKAYNVYISEGGMIAGFGMGSKGTTFYNSYVIGADGVTRDLANWTGGDYTVVSGLTLLMENLINDGSEYYTLDLSKIILQGGAIQKSVEDNSFSYTDDISVRVVDPESGEILDSYISGNTSVNWQVAANQRYVVDGGWGGAGSADGLIVYEGGEISVIFVGRPGPVSATGGTVITNGRYIYNDGTVVNFSCGNGYAENMVVENGRFVLNGYAGGYTEAAFGSGCVVSNTTMIGGVYVQGNLAYSDGLTTSNHTAVQTYSYAQITDGVNLDEAEDSIYRNFSLVGGVASGMIIENGGLLMLNATLTASDESLPTLPAGVASNLIIRGYRLDGVDSGNNARADGRSYLTVGAGATGDNIIVEDGGLITATTNGWTLTNLVINEGGAYTIKLGNDTILEATVDGYDVKWDGTSLNGLVYDGSDLRSITFADGIALADVYGLVINAAGYDAGSGINYYNTTVNATFNVGGGNTYNTIVVNDATMVMYSSSTINELTVNGTNSFLQFTTGETSNVQLLGGKIELAGSAVMNNVLVDGTLFNTEIGDTDDNSADHQTTQLVAYADGVTVSNLTLQSGGSAFFYNGAVADGVIVEDGGVLYLTNWGLSDSTAATVTGDLELRSGGTLYMGGAMNAIDNIETYEGSVITGVPGGTTIDKITLRGVTFEIGALQIESATVDGYQVIDGDILINNLVNSGGSFTLINGTIDNYSNAYGISSLRVNGGEINNLDLSNNSAAQLNGGAVLGGILGGGRLTDAYNETGVMGYVSAFQFAGGRADFTGTELYDVTVTGGTLSVGENAILAGVTVTGGTLNVNVEVNDVNATNGSISIGANGKIDGITAGNSVITAYDETDNVILNNANISGTGNAAVVQAAVGSATNITMNGGKYEALGNHYVDGITVDGAGLDDSTRNQFIAWAADVKVNALTLQNGASGFIYNGATLLGATVNDGGILYLTDRNQTAGTVANISGTIAVQNGGELYIGSVDNVFDADSVIQTYGGSTITMVDGVTLEYIVLRGANIDINDTITINRVLQGGNQSVDGGTVGVWQNNYGVLTVNGGSIDTYLHNNPTNANVFLVLNDGVIDNLNLTAHAGRTKLYGGVVNNATIGGGTVSDSNWADGSSDLVTGAANISNVTITGGALDLFYNGSVANNVTVNGGSLWIGRRDGSYLDNDETHEATANNVNMISGTTRIDANVNDMIMSGGVISMVGGTLNNIDIYGGTIVNWVGETYSGTINSATVHSAATLNGASFIWNDLDIRVNTTNYIAFGAKNTINNLKTLNSVSISAGSLVNGALIDSGAVMAGYAADTVYNDLTFKGNGTWAQLYAGTINNVKLYDKTKLEAGNGAKVYGALVDADGVELEFGDHKVGAHLGVYGDGAYASDVTLVNHGSATVFRNGTIEDFTATDGGALYVRGWSVATTEANGVASNGIITSTGGIWFAGGTLKDVTIEYGAWMDLAYSALTVYNNVQIGQEDGSYITVNFDAAEGGNLILKEGDVFYGNYAAGGGNASMTGTYQITMSDKATLMGWNLGSAKVSGQVILDDGSTVDFAMGEDNSYGGKGARNIYLYKGCAVLGGGSASLDDAGDVTVKYNTLDGFTVTGGDFIFGNMTLITDAVFSENVSIQTYSNANISGVNLDEAEDSIYRNFSLSGGVASGMIIENGGFIQLMNEGFNWKGNDPSPAGHAEDVLVRGSRTTAIGNYSTSTIATYNGGSFIQFASGTTGNNVTVESGAAVRLNGTGAVITNLNLADGAVLMIDTLDATTSVSGTNSYGEFSINGNVIDGLAVTDNLTYVRTAADLDALELSNLHLANGAAFSFANATVDGMSIVDYSGYYSFGEGNTVSNLTVDNARVSFTAGGVYNDVLVTNGSIATMYGLGTINDLTINEPLAWAQIGGGVVDGLTLTGGKLEAIGSATISNIVIDGTDYNTEIGDCADNSEEHQTTQLVAYAMDVSLNNMVVQSGGSAFVYNNAYINGNGDLTVSYSNGSIATSSAGVVVEDGGVLYFTNWALSEDIDGAYVEGDLWINAGGTLYLGTNNFYVERIQTMTGANIVGIASDTHIESMILRGANIDIDEKLSIGTVIQGGAQSIDGGSVDTWTNNYGVLTLNSGSIGTYISNNAANGVLVMNDGSIDTLDLSKSTAINYIAGGEIGSLVISSAGGILYDMGGDSEGSGTVIGSATINGQGGYVAGSWSWNGGTLIVRNDNTVVNNLTLNGGLAQIGNHDQGYDKVTANNVVVNNTTLRVDAIANDVTLNGSVLSVYGGAIDGLNAYSGSTIANYGSYTGTVKNANFMTTEDSNAAINAGAALINWSNVFVGEGFNGYTVFGSQSTINGLYAYSNVNVGACTTVTDVELYDGSILTNYSNATINGIKFYGKGTWAQVTGGVTTGLELYDTTKYECAGTNVVSGAVVDASGVDVEFRQIKVGAHLVLYAAGASATDVTLINKGSATVYNGATINNVVASEGGALYMVDWYAGTPATPGTANNVTITSTGAIWYKGGTMNNLTIESGATIDMTVRITDTINGTYVGIDGIGNLGYSMTAGSGSFVAVDGVTFVGNYTGAGGVAGSVNLSSLWLFEGASMVGWNLGTSTVAGYYVDGSGDIHKMIMGGSNEYGGKHAQNVYFYKGSAVLGTGAVSDDVVAYNTATGLIFDNSLFVLGNNTIVEDTVFRNGTSIQTYGNATLSGVNEDEAEDSVYRNFSIRNGVVSNFIVENGSFIQGMKAGNNWSTSPVTSYQNVLVRGARTEAAGNYTASVMDTYGGGSYITVTNGSDSDGITIEEGAYIVTQNTGDGAMLINNLTIAEGGNFIFNNLKSDTQIEGVYAGKEFFVANGMISGLVLDSDKLSVTAIEAMELNNVNLTAGTLKLNASGNTLSGDNYIGMNIDATTISEISGTIYLDNVEFTLGGGAADCSNLTQLTIDGGSFSTTDNDMRNASITITNGASASWAGGSLGSDSVVNVSGAGTTLNMSWQHADWGSNTPTMNITDGATANFGNWNCFGAVNVDNGGLYVSASGGSISQVNLNDGWVQFDGVGNLYSGNVTVTGTSSTSYYQLIGNQTGTATLKGAGAIFVGSGKWGAGDLDGGITVTTGSKDVGNVSLRNGSLTGLNMDGGTFWYNGSYHYSDDTADVFLYGDVSFKNAAINSGEDNTITVAMNSVDSLVLGNYVEINASIDAGGLSGVVLGAEGSIAEGKTVTVAGVNAFDFTNVKSFTVQSLLASNGDQFIVADGGEISIDTITVSNVEGQYILGDASYLNIDGGITVNVGTYVVNVTDYNTKFYTGASYSVTMTCEISVDDDNIATLTVYRTSSDEKVDSNWPESWTNAPTVNIEVTEDDVATYAVDGVLGLQECGPAAQVKFMYRDPATATNNNLALIGEESNGLYVVAGMMKPNQWGGRANTWIEVDGAQRITLIGGGTAEGGSISNATNLYITGEDTTATVYGGGGYGFTVANTNIVVDGATINRMYGGGYADGNWSAAKEITGQSVGGDVTGNVSIVTNSAVLQRVVVGGGYGNVGGNISIELNDSVKSAANVYGGTFNTTADTTVGGDVNISVNGGMFSGMFVGGSYVAGEVTSTIKGDVNVSISYATQLNAYRPDFSQTAWVIGGGYAVAKGSVVIDGAVSVTIDGSVVNNVIGGGAANEAGCTTSVGATNVTISNTLVTGDVFGGAYAYGTGVSSVLGDANLTFDTTSSMVTVIGNVYAGGKGANSAVLGNATVTFTGNADLLNYSGTLSGDGNYTAVTGDSIVSFANFYGEYSLNTVDFNLIKFSGDTTVTITSDTISGIDSLTFDLSERSADLAGSAMLTGGSFQFTDVAKLNVAGVAELESNASFVLMDEIADVEQIGGATIELDGLGSFAVGGSLDIEGYGIFSAVIDEVGALALNFELEVDGDGAIKKSLLA